MPMSLIAILFEVFPFSAGRYGMDDEPASTIAASRCAAASSTMKPRARLILSSKTVTFPRWPSSPERA